MSSNDLIAPVSRPRFARPIVTAVVEQHVDDCSVLIETRAHLVDDADVGLAQLDRWDERIAAHLDALVVAGDEARAIADTTLASPGPGNTFVVATLALLARDAVAFDRVLSLAESHAVSLPGLLAALGWVAADDLRGVVRRLLDAPAPFRRRIGMRACALHGVDPGHALDAAMQLADALARREAFRVSGDLGLVVRREACLAALDDADARCRFEAARSAVLLGDRGDALRALLALAVAPGPSRAAAVATVLKFTDAAQSRAVLERLAHEPTQVDLLIRGVGLCGDPHYVPWLIEQMHDPARSRRAGEAFTTLLGAEASSLARAAVDERNAGMDDPADDDLSMQADDSLPEPDPQRAAGWWQVHRDDFVEGRRYFVGRPTTEAHCRVVLADGLQRQRGIAAEMLCLLRPGTARFDIAAPARRQRRLLERERST